MTQDEGKNFRLKIKKLPTFENNVCVKFDSSRRKKIPIFFPLFGNFFNLESEIFSFLSSQFLRKRYSQMSAIFFISSRKLFPLSRVKFYANAILKCRQFFLSQVGIFSFVSSQILRKCYSQTSAIFLSWVRNFFLRLDLRWRKTFPTWDKKIADIWE